MPVTTILDRTDAERGDLNVTGAISHNIFGEPNWVGVKFAGEDGEIWLLGPTEVREVAEAMIRLCDGLVQKVAA